MKKYYDTLSKEEKNKTKEIYKNEYTNTDLKVRLVRLIIYSIIGYITSIFIFIDTIINKKSIVSNLLIAIPLFIASTVFLIASFLLKRKVLNKIALKNQKN